MTADTLLAGATCELCGKRLGAKEFSVCAVCDKIHDPWRVWKGRKMTFNSAPLMMDKGANTHT